MESGPAISCRVGAVSIYSDISALFGDVFGAMYLDGTLTQFVRADDSYGGGATAEVSEAVKLQVDACTERMREEEGYTSGDVRLIILQSGVGIALDTDCRATVDGATYIIASVDQDPAQSYWECRARPA